MATVTYATVNGVILHENRAGVQHDYMPDSLGSTYALLDDTQTMTDTFTYWPYGEVRTSTGNTVAPFEFVGTLGYFSHSEGGLNYVRARYFAASLAGWLTADPSWPVQPAYHYIVDMPLIRVSGKQFQGSPLQQWFQQEELEVSDRWGHQISEGSTS